MRPFRPDGAPSPDAASDPFLMTREEKGIRCGNVSRLWAGRPGVSPHGGPQGMAWLHLLLVTSHKACLSPAPNGAPAQGEGAGRDQGRWGPWERRQLQSHPCR